MSYVPGIDEGSHDLPAFGDPVSRGKRGAREIDLGENTILQEKAMNCALLVYEAADDLPLTIDPERYGTRGAREINWSEGAILEEKPMVASRVIRVVEPTDDVITITECAHDLPALVDPLKQGLRGPWEIDLGEEALVREKAVKRTLGIRKTADDLPALADPKGLSARGTRKIDLRNIDLGEIAVV